jgi:glycosyltransferase involved in cell wall biosynthesis
MVATLLRRTQISRGDRVRLLRSSYDEFVRHDVAIYPTSAGSAGFYDRSRGRAGGAERQMVLLARALAERGHTVAHVTYRPKDPVALAYPLTLVYRDDYGGDRRIVGPLAEARAVWKALKAANADVVVLRTASPLVAVAAIYCRLAGRAFVFSSSNISDFTLERMPSRLNRLLYRIGIRLVSAVVVQSQDQVTLAENGFPALRRLVHIPSFAEQAAATPSADAPPAAFLWFGRYVAQKQPMLYVELARSLPAARFRMIAVPGERGSRELAELRATAREVENLELLEPLPHAELSRLVASAVAVVNTSVLEGMPNAFLEAWACGVPVLTLEFDPDGVVERHGLGISARRSWDSFVAGARELWESREDRTEFAGRVRAYVDEVHSMEAVGARWSSLIDDLTTAKAPTTAAAGAAPRD